MELCRGRAKSRSPKHGKETTMLQELTVEEAEFVFGGGASVDANRDLANAEVGVGAGLAAAGEVLGIAGLTVAGAGLAIGGGLVLGGIALYELV